MKVKFPEESSTEAEDISLRFRTMHPNGLLFMTSSDTTTDSMELYLDQGAIELSVNVGSGTQVSDTNTKYWKGDILYAT